MNFQPSSDLNPYAPPVDNGLGEEAPSGDEFQLLAARSTRLGAHILDGLLYGAACVPGFVVFMFVIFDTVREKRGGDDGVAMMLSMIPMFLGMLALASYQWYLTATTGQTLAKKWLDIKIVKVDGSPVDFVSGVLLRSWVAGLMTGVPYIGSCVWLVDSLMIFGQEQRCLHDQIAGTKVIQVLRPGA